MEEPDRGGIARIVRRVAIMALAASCVSCFEAEVPGEVASTRSCPEGESCVSTAGLHFTGSIPEDLWAGTLTSPRIHPTAVGGTQGISFSRTLGDVVVTAEPAGIFEVVAQTATGVTLRGVSAGSATLSVRDASGRLYDRITLRAAEIEAIGLHPWDDDAVFSSEISPAVGWAFFPGSGEVTVVIALEGADGERLIDDAMAPVAAEGMSAPRWR